MVIIGIVGLVFSACARKESKSYSNPLAVEFGDPYVLKANDGKYYMYGTTENLAGFKTYSSDDLVEWTDEGVVYEGAVGDSWTKDCFWAPEVYRFNEKYYLFFSANWKHNPAHDDEVFRIGIAVSDQAKGPFKELNGGPLFDPGYPVIDANVLFTEEGRMYLYYSRCCYKNPVESEVAEWARQNNLFKEIEESWIYGVELKPDFSGVIGEPVLLLAPPKSMGDAQSEWESRSVTSKEVNRRWTEGSFMFKHLDTYYMMYSANYFGGENYAVGYATSKNPLGPFVKSANNPVLQKNIHRGGVVTGTGHNSVLKLEDGRLLCVYHGRTAETGHQRRVFIDPMQIDENGNLTVAGPTTQAQKIHIP